MRIEVARGWWRTRRAMRMSPKALAQRRARQWQALQPALARTPALAQFAGQPLAAFPITDIAEVRADYGKWNSLGLSDASLREMADLAERGEDTGEITAGWSTGSGGGSRGLFVADASERADYLGQSLARLLPPLELLHRQRIALHLRAGNALYSDVQHGRIAFRHVPLERIADEARSELEAFDPTILIAPPHRLLDFAKAGAAFPSLRYLFAGSEPMSGPEHRLIAAHFGLPPRTIWQATEGFLGADCRYGHLHLNDHAMEIELEPIPGTGAFRPIITDLRRHSQPVVRLRGDDIINLDDFGACPCGYSGRTIYPVEGRVGDLWRFVDRIVQPFDVTEAVDGALGAHWRWQAAASPSKVELNLDPACPPDLAAKALEALRFEIGPEAAVTVKQDLPQWPGPKRRKVVWNG